MIKAVCLTVSLGWLTCSAALGQEWLQDYNRALEAWNRQQTEEAYRACSRALELYKRQADTSHNNYRAILRQMSVICFDLGRLEEAAQYAGEEVQGWRQAAVVDESAFIRALDNLGLIYAAAGEYGEAIQVLSEAVHLASRSGQLNPAEVAVIEGHLAEALYGAGRLQESANRFANCMAVLDQQDELPADYLNFCYTYGALSLETEDYPRAIRYLLMVFEFLDKEAPDPLVIDTHKGLGIAYTRTGRLPEGESHLLQALQLQEQQATDNREAALPVIRELARNLELQGRHAEAEELLSIIAGQLQPTGTDKALLLSNRATVALSNGKVSEALDLYASALATLDSLGLAGSAEYLSIGLNYLTALSRAGSLMPADTLARQLLATPVREENYYLLVAEYGTLLQKLGRYREAEAQFERLTSLDLAGWPRLKAARLLNKMASFYQRQGRYVRSDSLYRQALSAVRIEDDRALYQSLMFNYLTLLQSRGELDQARQLLAGLKEEVGPDDSDIYLGLLRNMGGLAQSQGDFEAAASHYREAARLALAQYGENSLPHADIQLRLATLYKDQGRFGEAEELFLAAASTVAARQGRDTPNYAGVANNLGILYQEMGNYTKAEAMFEEAARIYRQALGDNSPDHLLVLENLATLYELQGRDEEALALLARTLEANRALYGSDNPHYAVSLHNYASLLQKNNRLAEAYALYEQALQIQARVAGERQPAYASTLQNMAVLAMKQENYPLADSLLERVLAIREELFTRRHPGYTAALLNKAILNQVTRQYEEALAVYDRVMDDYLWQIRQYFPYLSEKEKTAFYAKLAPAVNRYKEFCLEYYTRYRDDPQVLGRLYDVHLATKAILLNAVNKTRQRILNSGQTDLIDAFNRWTELNRQLVQYYTYTREQLQAARIDLTALEEEANRLEKELSNRSQVFAGGFDVVRPSWRQIANRLSPGEVAVEVVRIERNGADSVTYIALVVLPGAARPGLAIMPLGRKLETHYYNYYKNTTRFGIQDKRSYEAFWQPVDRQLGGARTIYLSVDGVFNKLNINTIYNPQESRYLIQTYFVKYLTNTRDLLDGHQSWRLYPGAGVLCLGDPAYGEAVAAAGKTNRPQVLQRASYYEGRISPLPGTRREVTFIDSLLTARQYRVQTYTGEAATESRVRQTRLPAVVHLATHGFFLADLPLPEDDPGSREVYTNPLFRSGLLFAGAGIPQPAADNDGVLTAFEAMNLNLDNTGLVVLSACETALGNIRNGEGVYGLQRALLVAGAANLIMSLWKVDDRTTMELMTLFYENLTAGSDVHKALQEAQLSMLDKYPEPYYWGAFILISK